MRLFIVPKKRFFELSLKFERRYKSHVHKFECCTFNFLGSNIKLDFLNITNYKIINIFVTEN